MLTNDQQQLSRKYILYKSLTSMWFIGAVWLYFYRLFMTDYQVGILDGMAFFIGVIAEVPSGALADRFGRGRMVKIGQFLAGSGLMMHVFCSGFIPFFIGQAIVMIGVAFVSGADEALFFEKLRFDRASTAWRKLVTRGSQAALIGSVCATVIGGLTHVLNPRLPWALNALAFFASIIVIWSLTDERVQQKKSITLEMNHFWSHIKEGFRQFFTSELLIYVPIIVAVQGLFYTAGWGILRLILLDRFYFDALWGSLVVAASSLLSIGILGVMHKHAEKIDEKQVIVVAALAGASGLLLSLFDIGMWGFFVIFMLYAGERVLHPFMSEILNNRTTDKHRATVLSVSTFLYTLPYVLLAPIIGYLSTHDQLEPFFILWTLIIIIAVAFYISSRKKNLVNDN